MTQYPEPYHSGNIPDYPYGAWTVRHCNGSYDPINYAVNVIPPCSVGGSSPTFLATRVIFPSPFAGDAAGAVYAGGFVAVPSTPVTNTDWLWKGAN